MDSENRRIAKNTALLYVRMLFALIVSLYTSRVVLRSLGVNDYGIYSVVAGFVSMFGFFNATLSSSMQRFYNYEGSRKGINGYIEVYKTGLIIHSLLGIALLFLLETVGLWYVNNIMVITEGRLAAANIVFQSSILSMLLVVFQIPYVGAILADEKMNFYAFISIIDVVLKLLAVLILPLIPYDGLIVYSVLLLAISLFDFVCYFVYSKAKVFKQKIGTVSLLSINKEINKGLFKSIMNFSGWNLLGTFAYLLKGQGINMLLNYFWGPVVNAARGIAMQVNGGVSGLTGSVPIAFRPQIVNSYASDNEERCQRLMFIESKVCYSLILFLAVPIISEMEFILQTWLGDFVPNKAGIFASLVLLDSLICAFNTPLTQVAYAVGNIKRYQIYSACVNVTLLPVCYCLLRMGFNEESVFVATVVFSFFNNLVCLYSLKKLFFFSLRKYISDVIVPCLILTLLLPIVPIILLHILDVGLFRLFLICLSVCVIGFPSLLFIVLTKSERSHFLRLTKLSWICQR